MEQPSFTTYNFLPQIFAWCYTGRSFYRMITIWLTKGIWLVCPLSTMDAASQQLKAQQWDARTASKGCWRTATIHWQARSIKGKLIKTAYLLIFVTKPVAFHWLQIIAVSRGWLSTTKRLHFPYRKHNWSAADRPFLPKIFLATHLNPHSFRAFFFFTLSLTTSLVFSSRLLRF